MNAPSPMTVGYQILRVDGSEEQSTVTFKGAEPMIGDLRELIMPIVGGDMERVLVFWDNRYRDMFVNERGHLDGLKLNARATEIYHNNMRVHDPEAFDAGKPHPTVVGDVILFGSRVWF